jgi:dolichyl-phosphate beta-glucosyltransferase
MSTSMADRVEPAAGAKRCLVVIPCYNEAGRLNFESFYEFLATKPPIDLLFVDDGSQDHTLRMLRELQVGYPQVQVLALSPNGGKAEAVRRGMLSAITQGQYTFTGFWDADLAAPLPSIDSLMQIMEEKPEIDMVFGARVRLLGHHINRKPVRHYLGRCFATAVSSLLQLPVYDTQCGAKIFRITPMLRQILTKPFSSRWIFDVEIIARFLALHGKDRSYVSGAVYEFPLAKWQDVAGSKVSSLDFFKAFYELMCIYNSYLR